MGCTASTERRDSREISKTVDSEHGDFLSEYQKQLLRRTWEPLSHNPIGLGGEIFIRIFKRRPSTKQLFPFKDYNGEELYKHPQFKGHSKRFMHAVETTIQHLDALELVVVPTLIALGKRHTMITDEFVDYQSVFCEVIVDIFEETVGRSFTKEVRVAWTLFIEFIANTLLEGYELGKKENAAMGNNADSDCNVKCCADRSLSVDATRPSSAVNGVTVCAANNDTSKADETDSKMTTNNDVKLKHSETT